MNPLYVTRGGYFWQVFTYRFVHGRLDIFCPTDRFALFRNNGGRRSGQGFLCSLLSGTLCAYALFVTSPWGDLYSSWVLRARYLPPACLCRPLSPLINLPLGHCTHSAPVLVIGYAVMETLHLIGGVNTGVAHATHLIGFAVAWLYFLIRFGINPLNAWFGGRRY